MWKECFLAQVLQRAGAVLFGDFVLSSGKRSSIYIDLRRTLSDTLSARILLAHLAAETSTCISQVDMVVGVATAGIPWAAMLSSFYGVPMAYVRPEEKQHGTRKLVEGDVSGRRVLVIDDVATTGKSLLNAIRVLRGENAIVEYAAVIVDREEGAQQLLEKHGVKLLSVVKLRDILNCTSPSLSS